jgi:pyruvate/2-oxoglutarate dehydrogenase complex dihydrolipoamide acyltransferase (E2) component
MPEAVYLPKWGLTMTEGTVVNWLKQVGDRVTEGEDLVEVETEKVLNVLPAPISGVLAEIRVAAGETVDVGAELALIVPAE